MGRGGERIPSVAARAPRRLFRGESPVSCQENPARNLPKLLASPLARRLLSGAGMNAWEAMTSFASSIWQHSAEATPRVEEHDPVHHLHVDPRRPSGPHTAATPENLVNAVGNYADPILYAGDDEVRDERRAQYAQNEALREWERAHPGATSSEVAAARLQIAGLGAKPLDHGTAVGNMESSEDRVRILNMLTQNADLTAPAADGLAEAGGCGSASILAGVIYAGGSDGLLMLLDGMKADLPPDQRETVEIRGCARSSRPAASSTSAICSACRRRCTSSSSSARRTAAARAPTARS